MDDKLINPRETEKGIVEPSIYYVGNALALYFEHDPQSPISMSYVTSKIYLDTSDFTGNFFSALRAYYSLDVMVRINDQQHILENREFGQGYFNASDNFQIAIEKTIQLLSRKVSALKTGK